MSIDPQIAKKAAGDLRHLEARDIAQLRALHYYDDGSKIECLDLSLSADTVETLDSLCKEKLSTMGGGDILPAAPPARWMEFVRADFVRQRSMRVRGIGSIVIPLRRASG